MSPGARSAPLTGRSIGPRTARSLARSIRMTPTRIGPASVAAMAARDRPTVAHALAQFLGQDDDGELHDVHDAPSLRGLPFRATNRSSIEPTSWRPEAPRGLRPRRCVRRNHHDGVAQRGDFVHHVTRKEDARALVAQRAQQRVERASADHVQTARRLVENQVLRGVDESAGDRDFHALALRERARQRAAASLKPSRSTS